MIRIGILGAAKIAPAAMILPVSRRDDCTVVAIAARDPGRARAFAATHGIPEIAESYEALIARPDIDLIYNALPPNRHADLSIAALQAGKHVLCEKPFAMNAGEAMEMHKTARGLGLSLMEAFHYRFHPAFIAVIEQLRTGAIGEVRHIAAAFSVAIADLPGELRHDAALGGGALMDLGCYPCHWVRTLTGETARVTAAACERRGPNIDLTMTADLAFPSGVTAQIHTSMAPGAAFCADLRIEGEVGTLAMRNPLAPHLGHQITLTRGGASHTWSVSGLTTYDHQLAHVVDVFNVEEMPWTGGNDAVANMALIDAIYTAAGMRPRGT